MLMDYMTTLSDQQAITADAKSTNIMDLSTDKNDLGKGGPINLAVQVTEDFATLTSLGVAVETSNDPAFGSFDVIGQALTLPVADLKAGKNFSLQFMPQGTKRYVRLGYDVTGTNATAGKVTAGVVVDHQSNNV